MIRVTREVHEVPPAIAERVTRAGGTNWLGEPNFRVVWGGSRLTWLGGHWVDRDTHGNVIRECVELRRVPKYLPTDRWHIELWVPPEAYGSREHWWTQTMESNNGISIPALGPFPSRGEYEHCFTLQTLQGEFLGLTATACDWVVRAVEWARHQSRSARRAAVDQREVRHNVEWDRIADDILSDATPAFHGQTFLAM
jgi:hypothetical protein